MSSVQPVAPLAPQPAPDQEHEGIVTKLTQLVRITENAVPEPSKAVQQIALLAHTLVAEISTHLRAQDRRIAELEHLATTDTLTRVMNRRGFEDRLTHELQVARRHGVGGVLIFVDLDGFKPVNDTHGHAAGDQVLMTVANLLRGHIRTTDYLGRMGGDEFAILLPRSNKRNGLRRTEELDRKLNNAYAPWNGHQIPIRASCGVHMYSAQAEMAQLLEAADEAMYKIKEERKLKGLAVAR